MTQSGPDEFDASRFFSSFCEVALGVLMSPWAFFRAMRRTGGLRPPFLFLFACLVIHTLIVGSAFDTGLIDPRPNPKG